MTMDVPSLAAWYLPALTPEARTWVADQVARPAALRAVAIAIGQVPRRVGNAPLAVPPAGWPRGWTVAQAVRVHLLTRLHPADRDQVFATADLEELVAFYQGLAVLPDPAGLRARAAEGVRSNAVPVFTAVACHNPYPAAWLEEGPWNQLVLKAVFVGADLDAIIGLQARRTPTLARMLADLVRERTAARRSIDPRVLALL